jgi:death-on-curing protein
MSKSKSWRWITFSIVNAIHDRQLSEHGGPAGVRDQGAIESALARAPNLDTYGEPDAADLAAAYAFGIARNHGFVDGNKRTAWVIARVFLADNGCLLKFDPQDAVRVTEMLAAGKIDEQELAAWFRQRMVIQKIDD